MPEFPNPYRHWAWILASCPQGSLRDGPKAVSPATRALEPSQWTMTDWFEVLAAAYAESGDFAEAARWKERHAQSLRESTRPQSESRRRLDQYQLGLPHRATGATTS